MAIAFIGQALGFIARVLMAKKRFLAVKILIVATVIALGWALYIQDWPNVAGQALAVGLQFWTLKCWKAET